ncbi:MAG: hypothetical protein LUQ60_06865 [Methanomicrobiales archaeon]|nr:hypothetical protein [Methanomicrobiales archaeon]
MERGDLAAVLIGLTLVIILTVVLSPPAHSTPRAPEVVATTRVPTTPVTPVPETTIPTSGFPTPPPATTERIFYTNDYYLFPVRYLPSDMSIYGFSDVEWPYNSSVAFAYIEENHGGITEPFTVPYPVWRMTSTLYATRTPEQARFRMILVDEQSGRVLEGAEIRFPGSITKTVVAGKRPVYMIIAAENVDRFIITLEIPSAFAQ